MDILDTVLVFVTGKHRDSTREIFSILKEPATNNVGSARVNLVITNVSETKCSLADPSQEVAE
jgi:hypothetical protein